MKKRIVYLVLAALMCVNFAACSSQQVSGYRVVGDIGGEELCVAFREGDKLREIISAGMMVLSADGTLGQLSAKWLGGEAVTIAGDSSMAPWLENQPQRVLILGYYSGARPLCYEENGAVAGFDADMFTELCSRLGWELRFQEIGRGTAAVELSSGNVDCVAGGYGTGDDASGLSCSPNYLSIKYEIVSKADGISRKSQLKGKTLATLGSSAMGKALEGDTKLMERLGSLGVYASEEECFTALDAGLCDAVLVSSLCADYYMR